TYACHVPNVATVEEQRRHTQAECVRAGLTPDGEFSDERDGAWCVPLARRASGRRLLAALAPGDTLLVATPVALASSLSTYAALVSALHAFGIALRLCGVTAAAAGAPAGGRVGRTLRAVAADSLRAGRSLASLPKGEQIKAGLAFAKANGRRTGRYP